MFEDNMPRDLSKINSMCVKSMSGILSIEDGKFMVEVNDKMIDPAIVFSAFNGNDILISCTVIHEESPEFYIED